MAEVSIFMSTFNKNNVLPMVLYSLKQQVVNFDYNVCIIDDCSKEDPEPIIRKYFQNAKYKRLEKHTPFDIILSSMLDFIPQDTKIVVMQSADVVYTTPDILQQFHDKCKTKKAILATIYDTTEKLTNENDVDNFTAWCATVFDDWLKTKPRQRSGRKILYHYFFLGAILKEDLELFDKIRLPFCDIGLHRMLIDNKIIVEYPETLKGIHLWHPPTGEPCQSISTCSFLCKMKSNYIFKNKEILKTTLLEDAQKIVDEFKHIILESTLWFFLGRAFQYNRCFDKAEYCYMKCITCVKEYEEFSNLSANLIIFLKQIYSKENLWDSILTAFKQNKNITPNMYHLCGLHAYDNHLFLVSTMFLTQYFETGGTNIKIWETLSSAYSCLKMWKEALAAASKTNLKNKNIQNNIVIWKNKLQEEEEKQRIALEVKNKRNTEAIFVEAQTYRKNKQFEKAIQMYKKYLEVGEQANWCYLSYYFITMCLKSSKKQTEARETLSAALDRFPQMVELYYELGKMAYDVGRYQESLLWFEKSCSLPVQDTMFSVNTNKYCWLCWDALSMTYHHLQRWEDAIRAAETALKVIPRNARIKNNIMIWKKITGVM